MKPEAVDRAGGRGRSRGVAVALGLSVSLHVLGVAVLPRARPELARPPPRTPLEVELVWREAGGGAEPTGAKASAPAAPAAPARSLVAKRLSGRRVTATAPPEEAASQPPAAPEPPSGAILTGAEAIVSSFQATAGATGEGAAGARPPGDRGGGGGDAGQALEAYREWLSRWVARQRRYPAHAVRLGMEGTARVRLRINRDGTLAGPPRLEGSSRFRVLDVEALRMVEAAAPFSPLPEGFGRDTAELIIPVSFSLRAAAG